MSSDMGVACLTATASARDASRGATGSWVLNGGRRRSPELPFARLTASGVQGHMSSSGECIDAPLLRVCMVLFVRYTEYE